MKINGSTVVITGSSSGIGAAAARRFAERGATVCVLARRADLLEDLCGQIAKDGGTAHAYPVDLTDREATGETVNQILTDHPRVDALINNAARSIRRSINDSFDRLHDYERTMEINYLAPVDLTLKFLPHFKEQERGHIVFSSTMSTQLPVPLFSAYVASKAALESFAYSVGSEFAHRNITTTVVHFPLVRTDMSGATGHYESMRMMSARRAGGWLVNAVEKRPTRISSPLGFAGQVGMAASPEAVIKVVPRMLRGLDRQLDQKGGRV